jgi:TonB family protein
MRLLYGKYKMAKIDLAETWAKNMVHVSKNSLTPRPQRSGLHSFENMKLIRELLINCVVLFFCITVSHTLLAQENFSAIAKKIQPSVVTILTYDRSGKGLMQGSGFFISQDGDIITCRHVLQGSSSANVKTAEGKVYPVTRVIAEDKEGDLILASVNISHDTVRPLSVSASIPEVGERVLVIGSPLGLETTVSDGIVSAVRDTPEFGKIIQITAPISQGSSGSPLVNMKGEVIGVTALQKVGGQNLNFAISGVKVARLMADHMRTLTQDTAESPSHIYKWVDEKGVIHFSDSPPPNGATLANQEESEKTLQEPIKRIQHKVAVEDIEKRVEARGPAGEGSSGLMAGGGTQVVSPDEAYGNVIREKIMKKWGPPENFSKQENKIIIDITIGRDDGKVKKLSFEESSGNDRYDQMAIRAIRQAEPFPPIPEDCLQDTFGIMFFSLGQFAK